MPKKLDQTLLDILTKYGERPEDALWDCHGTWVAYHKAIERIAAKAEIAFDMPVVVEGNANAKIVSIIVKGRMGDNEDYREEWSFGEASPSNNKNAYPYAMAEKRAKDRVVLKLIGLHGLVYSEEETDDFKPGQPEPQEPPKSSASLKRDGAWEALKGELESDFADCHSIVALNKLRETYRDKAKAQRWPPAWLSALKDEFDQQEDALKKVELVTA